MVALLFAGATHASRVSASDPGSGDWPMWGGTPDRNMVSTMKGLPTEWDVKTKKNVKWIAELGSQSYGNPVVAGGMVFVGTNNERLRDPKQPGDRGVLMAFRESDGEFLWQQTHEKLAAGRANDWPYQGVASSPLVEGTHLYYTSNRGVVWCLDINGFRDGKNDGPVTDEKLTGQFDADVIWSFDMMEEVGSYPHNMSNSSPVIWGDLVFVSTSNGQDESHVHIPSPKAPAIIALNKNTGKLVWEDNSVEDRILHGQWSTPSVGRIGGVDQVVSAQGDGWVRGYEAATGKKLWEFDTNPKDSVWPKTRNELIATPVIYQDRVYIGNGQDPEHGEGVGHFYCIDATKRGDITQSGRVWQFDKIRRSISTASIVDGLLYVPDFSGFLHCLDAKTGQEYWTHDMFAAVWGSTLVVDGKADPSLLETYDGERAPIGKQIVRRANKSIQEFGAIFDALGLGEARDPERMRESMQALKQDTPAAAEQRQKLREAMELKNYEFNAHGVEMGQFYESTAVVSDGSSRPEPGRDPELYFQPSTVPGARLPHVWVGASSRVGSTRKLSTLDLAPYDRFTLITGIAGSAWAAAAASVARELGVPLEAVVIGPGREVTDIYYDWARIREVAEEGALLVRPDKHIGWRSAGLPDDPVAALRSAMASLLSR